MAIEFNLQISQRLTDKKCFLRIIADPPKGKEYVWLLGDRFIKQNADVFIKTNKMNKQNFLFSNFELESYSSDETSSNNPSTLSRMRNLIIRSFGRHNKLPKYIIIVFKDALVQAVNREDFGVLDIYKDILTWLLREYRRSILEIKDKLPKKCTKTDEPHILLLAPTVHKNYKNDVYR